MRSNDLLSLLLLVALLIGCSSNNLADHSIEQNFAYEFSVENYDQYYELDPEGKSFKSSQKISIINVSEKHPSQINFSLHPKLVIDQIIIRNLSGKEIPIKQWNKIAVRRTIQNWADKSLNEFPVYQIHTSESCAPRQQLLFEIDYHLDAGFIKDYPEKIYEL